MFMGYIRQPVYSCLTCNPNPSEEAGFCYSCSISCHGEHNLVELFTKRSFRCDCGTIKFKSTKCKLDPKPEESNNELNQCDIQYDPHKEESTMLQCVVCEDWFHDTCIGITPHNDDFDDFICSTCTRTHPFLRGYAQNSLFMIGLSEKGGGPKSITMVDCSKNNNKDNIKKEELKKDENDQENENAEVDVVTTEATSESTTSNTTTTTTITTTLTTDATTTTNTTVTVTSDSSQQTTNQAKRSLETTVQDEVSGDDAEPSQNKRVKLEAEICKRNHHAADVYQDQEMNLFATEGWRDLLCQCTECMELYTKENIPFILGEEAIYEDEEDDEAETSILESGMKKLNEMDRVQMMDGMLAYNKMRDEIRNFLAPFSEQGKVVTADDVQAFFTAKMEKRAALGGKPNFF
ncbi:hypothetical protein BGZ46_006113 [Entomortierella lignicola]|nr:hypothetical protein BGZ46_006113 [Entomortierella lignicola]